MGQFRENLVGGFSRGGSGYVDEVVAFVFVHETGGFQELGFFVFGDGEEAVFVGVDELPGGDFGAEDFDFAAPVDWAGVGVADTESAGQCLESGVVHFVNIADGSVSDGADAAEGFVDVAIHFSPEGAVGVGFVEVLDDDNFGSVDGRNVVAVLVPCVRIFFGVFGVAGLDDTGDGVADHGAHGGHEVVGFFVVEGVSCGVLLSDLFPAVVDGGGIPAFELKEFRVGERVLWMHVVGVQGFVGFPYTVRQPFERPILDSVCSCSLYFSYTCACEVLHAMPVLAFFFPLSS